MKPDAPSATATISQGSISAGGEPIIWELGDPGAGRFELSLERFSGTGGREYIAAFEPLSVPHTPGLEPQVLPAGVSAVRRGFDLRAEGVFDAFGCARERPADCQAMHACQPMRASGSRRSIGLAG